MAGKRKRTSSMGAMKKRRTRGLKRRRGRKSRKSIAYVKFSRMPVPDRYKTILNYSDTVLFNMTAADLVNIYQFRSSLWDPDLTGAGHKPLWTNEMTGLYTSYRINGFKYRITFKNSNVQQLTWGCIHHMPSTGTIDSAMNTARERRGSRRFELPSNNAGVKTVKGYVDVAKVWGMTKSEMMYDEGFEASLGSNPTNMAHLVIYLATKNTSATVQAAIDVQFYVELWKRKDAATS